MKIKVTAIFDIGKTNKKFFLFDNDYQEVYREYIRFDEIKDEDDHPTENLPALQEWLKEVFYRIVELDKYHITAINFSTYGASFVYLNDNGKVLTPLYSYTKPIESKIENDFYAHYGPEDVFTKTTGSPKSGMLNSGMQLYWLKRTKPEVFNQVKYALHFPQYLSYIFTGIPLSEYTSIGCHTALWNYKKKDYHHWVYKEEIDKILPPIVSAETSINMNYNGKRIKIGVGIHDSSSALIPYVRSVEKPFVLVSTGTWSVSLNPFTKDVDLSQAEIKNECINYMRVNGRAVKSSRIFLGNEYNIQVKKLAEHYNVTADYHKTIDFNYDLYTQVVEDFEQLFCWESLKNNKSHRKTKYIYDNYELAYHHLMTELALLQVQSIKTAVGDAKIKQLYVDGGFTDNDIFIRLLSHYLRDMKLNTTTSSLGSALGAAIVISDSKLNSKFLKENYCLKKHVPFIVK